MIHFFRKIRRNLLENNNLKKYLLYAIGEVLIVMIGILIAVGINNWNQTRLLKIEEVKSLKSLHSEMQDNLIKFDNTYNQQLEKIKAVQKLLFTNLSNYNLRSLDTLVFKTVENYTYNPSLGIYNTMINSGKIELVTNDNLKNRISQFKDVLNDYFEEEKFAMDFSHLNYQPYIIENFAITPEILSGLRARTKKEKLFDRNQYKNIFDSKEFINIMSFIMIAMDAVTTDGAVLRTEMELLIKSLESEIEKNEKRGKLTRG